MMSSTLLSSCANEVQDYGNYEQNENIHNNIKNLQKSQAHSNYPELCSGISATPIASRMRTQVHTQRANLSQGNFLS